MVILPIVERELRRATRQKSTYRIRMLTAIIAAAMGLIFLAQGAFIGGSYGARIGGTLFRVLAYLIFGLAQLSGVFLAADCISQEKREGTLGLLFLTDLRGYDVVLGKFTAAGLRAFYSLLAALPIMAFPLFMGGVTGSEYWRVSLSLVNALFFSLALGVLVSTFSRNGTGTMRLTFSLLFLLVVALPFANLFLSRMGLGPMGSYSNDLMVLSPYGAFNNGFATAYYLPRGFYLHSLLATNLCAWLMLGISSWALPRVWQDNGKAFAARTKVQPQVAVASAKLRFSESEKRRVLLNENPVTWLASRNSNAVWIRILTLLAIVASVLCLLVTTNLGPVGSAKMLGVGVVISTYGWILKLMLVFESCRFYNESRRDGAIELLMSTPLTGARIVAGHSKALTKLFFWPTVVYVSLSCVSMAYSLFIGDKFFGSPRNFASSSVTFSLIGMRLPLFALSAYGLIRWCCDMLAIAWVGMWLSLSVKKPSLAGFFTLVFVVIIPAMVCFLPNAVIDLVLIQWARQNLISRFRETVLPGYYPRNRFPGLAAPPPKPPVIV